MAKKKNNMVIIVLVILAIFAFRGGIGPQAITGSETMTRTGPAMVDPSSTFQITYTAVGTSGAWGASILDSNSGGCAFPSGSPNYQTVMLSEDGLTKTVSITSPASGTCTFVGDYQFGTFPITALNAYSVNICAPTCTRPGNLCIVASTVSDGCGGDCTGQWTVNQLTSADQDCTNDISRIELGGAIVDWIGGSFSRTDLGTAIQSWAGG